MVGLTVRELAPFVGAAPFLTTAAIVDLREHRLPTSLMRAAAVALGAVILVVVVVDGAGSGVIDAGAGAVLAAAVPFAMWAVAPGSIGFGDVRLMALCGALVGWLDVGLVPVMGVVAVLLTTPLAVTARRASSGVVPFGPGIVGATLLIPVFLAMGR